MRILLVLIILFFNSGCLRYVESRGFEPGGTTSLLAGDESAYIIDEEIFYQHEKIQEQRLQRVIARRNKVAPKTKLPTYHIGSSDLLQVSVFDVEEFKDLPVRVRPSGYISLPLIGAVKAENKTEAELQRDIEAKLDEFLYNPQVTVFVEEYGAHKVAVIGEVNEPGRYPLKRDSVGILDMISEAGGKTKYTNGIVILIPADEDPSRGRSRARLASNAEVAADFQHGIEIYYEDLIGRGGRAAVDFPVLPGDVIVVQEPGTVHVDGEVKTPGAVQPISRMTLLGSIAAANGLTYSADMHKVEVVREVGQGKLAYLAVDLEEVSLRSGRDIRLRDGDVVRVPSQTTRFVTRQFVDMFNRFVDFTVGGSVDVAR